MMSEAKSIGDIGNYYGGLYVRIKDGQPQWSIEDYDAHFAWEDIPQSLYDELIKFEESRP